MVKFSLFAPVLPCKMEIVGKWIKTQKRKVTLLLVYEKTKSDEKQREYHIVVIIY